MTKISLDMSGAGALTPITEADYHLKVTKAEVGMSKKGKQKVHFEFGVLSRLDGSPVTRSDGKPAGEKTKLFRDQSVDEDSRWSFANILMALGYKEEEVIKKNFAFDTDEFLGRECIAHVIVDDSYDGTPRNQIQKLMPVGVAVS